MAKKLVYTGALGPASIRCGKLRFKKGHEVQVDDDKTAEQLLKKGCFKVLTKSARKAAKKQEV